MDMHEKSAFKTDKSIIVMSVITLVVYLLKTPFTIRNIFNGDGDKSILSEIVNLVIILIGVVLLVIVCIELYSMLKRVDSGEMFSDRNALGLARITHCFVWGGLVFALAGIFYPEFGLIPTMMLLTSVILSIVQSIFKRAVEMKKDVDFTV
jgi:hypothetical protein